MSLHLSNIIYDVAPAQVFFGLNEAPLGPLSFVVNGMVQRPGHDFTVVTSGATWVSPDFGLAPGDVVELQYLTNN